MKKLIYSSLLAVLVLSLCIKNTRAQVASSESDADSTIYNFVSMETPPNYPGGIENFYKFLGENIKYPEKAKADNVQGNVFVSFTVEKDGSLNNLKVDRRLGTGTDEEAIRVLKLSRRWNPGLQNGKAVRVKYNIPIKFAIPGVKPKPKTPVAVVIPGETNTDENTVYNFVSMSNPPKYVGGIAKLYDFLMQNIKYPTLAKENKIEGNVFVSFVVEKDGTLSHINVDRKLGYGTDEEAVRVLGMSPKWEPGILNDKPARVKYNIPIRFSLAKTQSKN